MKKLVVVFVALTFLATFSLIGCNQSPARRRNQPRRRERKEHLEHLEHPERPERLEHLEHPDTCTRKKIDAGYRVYPRQEDIPFAISVIGKKTFACSVVPELTAISCRTMSTTDILILFKTRPT